MFPFASIVAPEPSSSSNVIAISASVTGTPFKVSLAVTSPATPAVPSVRGVPVKSSSTASIRPPTVISSSKSSPTVVGSFSIPVAGNVILLIIVPPVPASTVAVIVKVATPKFAKSPISHNPVPPL